MDKKRTAAEVYREVEDRGPDPAFARQRSEIVARALAARAAKRAESVTEAALRDWRKLSERRRDARGDGR